MVGDGRWMGVVVGGGRCWYVVVGGLSGLIEWVVGDGRWMSWVLSRCVCGGRGVGDLFIHPCGYAVGGGSTTNVEGPLKACRPCGALPVVKVGGGGWRQVEGGRGGRRCLVGPSGVVG